SSFASSACWTTASPPGAVVTCRSGSARSILAIASRSIRWSSITNRRIIFDPGPWVTATVPPAAPCGRGVEWRPIPCCCQLPSAVPALLRDCCEYRCGNCPSRAVRALTAPTPAVTKCETPKISETQTTRTLVQYAPSTRARKGQPFAIALDCPTTPARQSQVTVGQVLRRSQLVARTVRNGGGVAPRLRGAAVARQVAGNPDITKRLVRPIAGPWRSCNT